MTARAGSIIASVAAAVIDAAVERGVAREPLEAVIGGVPADLAQRIPYAKFLTLWEHAMRACRYDGLPMMVAQGASLERFGLAGYALYVSSTVGAALRRLARFHDLVTDSGAWSIRPGPTHAVLVWTRPGERTLGMRVANEQALGATVMMIERLLGSLPLVEVHFRHPAPADLAAHERLFRVPLRFGQEHEAIILPTSALDQPSPGFDPHLERYFVAEAEAAVARIGASEHTAAQVSREILAVLADGIPTAQRIAARLGISDRTLRRRLADERRSFEELVRALQRDRADTMLRAGKPIAEVALATGFSDPSSFTRAYKRWTGSSPSRPRDAGDGD